MKTHTIFIKLKVYYQSELLICKYLKQWVYALQETNHGHNCRKIIKYIKLDKMKYHLMREVLPTLPSPITTTLIGLYYASISDSVIDLSIIIIIIINKIN
jgi:hypothetical protein